MSEINPPNTTDLDMHPEEKVEDNLSSSEAGTTKTNDNNSKDSDDHAQTEELKEETTNDGVKILEEVFGKASVGDDEEN